MSTLTKHRTAIVLKNERITKDSSKVTHHLEVDISSQPFSYQAGDAIGVLAKNDPNVVDQIIQLGTFSKRAEVQDRKANPFDFETFLLEKADLQRASHKLIQAAKLRCAPMIEQKLELLSKEDFVSVLQLISNADFREMDEQEFVSLLKPMTSRFYSIASSPKVNPNQIDLLVTLSSYPSIFDESILGTCTDYLCHRVAPETEITIHHHPAKNFALPVDERPILMIGPGTGLAPFRGFLQERILDNRNANWLFFGERNQTSDFYYQQELEAWQEKGALKLTTAFSRDQEQKIYVQDRLWQQKELVWDWVANQAVIYICGDAKLMARAVQDTLVKIFDEQTANGLLFLKQLRKDGRLLLDVY